MPTNSKSPTSESADQVRQRCYRCFRPQSLCFCETIPQIDNLTDVLMLQHAGERFHPFNTARIVNQALCRCQVVVGHGRQLDAHRLPIQAGAGLLYPGANAMALTQLPVHRRPSQLVIVDGTWHHAKTMVRDVAQLRDLPCYRLTPEVPGQFRIRREPNAQSLSTLEATVAALRVLEPDTVGWDQLLAVFHTMIENQLAHSASHAAWRKNKKRESRPRNLPLALLQNPSRLVVAYGEATPGQRGQRTTHPAPVNWVAQRLDTPERFSCLLRQDLSLSATSLQHMRLSAGDFDTAVSPEEFCRRWNQFLRPDDALIVYHQKTCQLLQPLGASQPRCLVLKSIFGRWRTGFRSQEELMEIEGLPVPILKNQTRAIERLDQAVTLARHLRSHYGN